MRRFLLLILVSLFLLPVYSYAADNPFVNKPEKQKKVKRAKYPKFLRRIYGAVTNAQHDLNKKMSEITRRVKNGETRQIFILLLIAFIYGIIHAIGPGHGKFIAFSFFLSKKAKAYKGIVVGSAIALMHSSMAIILVMAIYFIVKQAYLASFENFSRFMKIVSFSLISIIGVYMLTTAIIGTKKKSADEEMEYSVEELNLKEMLSVIIPLGLIPCPGTAIILIFFLSLDLVLLGIVSALFVALGMAVTISAVCLLTILGKKGILKLWGERKPSTHTFESVTEIISSSLIILLGAFLLFMTI